MTIGYSSEYCHTCKEVTGHKLSVKDSGTVKVCTKCVERIERAYSLPKSS